MPVSTSTGEYHDKDFDYWHEQLFGKQDQQPEGEDKLYIVRHGDTALNDEDVVHGWVNAPLNEAGVGQAHKAAESLKDKDVTRIVSSDLPRAKQTANIISKSTDAPVTFDSNLRTWDSGDLDFTDKHQELCTYTEPDKSDTPPPGSSETFNQFKDRILTALTGHAANNDGHRTVVVTHSKPMGVFNAWEHAGYPEDQSIHLPTYEEKDSIKPGGHEELSIPDHILQGVKDFFLGPNPGVANAINSVINPAQEQLNDVRDMVADPSRHRELAAMLANTGSIGMVRGLTAKQVGTIMEMYNKGMKFEDIAKEMNMTKGKVSGAVNRAKEQMVKESPDYSQSTESLQQPIEVDKETRVVPDSKFTESRSGVPNKSYNKSGRYSTKELQSGEPDWLAEELGLKMKTPSQQQQGFGQPSKYQQELQERQLRQKNTLRDLEDQSDIHEAKMDDLREQLVEGIRDEKPELNEQSAHAVMEDMLKGEDYDMPQHITDMIEDHKELYKDIVANKRALEIVRKDPDLWDRWMSNETKAKLRNHTDADHRTLEEWKKEAEAQGHDNPFLAAGRASRGEWDIVHNNWSIGGKKTSIIDAMGKLNVYQHGDPWTK